MIILGPARSILIKPFILLGYLEACAMFFSLLGIVAAIIGLIFYRPYRYISDRIYIQRARHAAQARDARMSFEAVPPDPAAYTHNPEEDGAPD